MITFDVLNKLSKSCVELISNSKKLEAVSSDKKLSEASEKIIKSLRKIIIANELYGKQVICISGLQGAGKTTLMKNFYELDDDILNISLGRGEKIPVFISEKKECKVPEMYAKEIIKSNEKNNLPEYNVREKKITKEQFVSLSKGEDFGSNIMYLELKLPFKHIKNEHTMFMLLPGYERKRDYWRNLIDFSVNCSDSAIFVFSESSFAREDNDRLLENIKKTFKKKLIYVISHSDTSIDENKEVKKTCMKVMEIPNEQADRVVCAGSYSDRNKNIKWINELMHAVNEYCTEGEKIEQKCSEYICTEIENEIIPSIGKIREALNGYSTEKVIESLEQSEWLDAFQNIVKKEKKKYEKNLTEAIDSAFNDSCKKIERFFSDKKYAKHHGVKKNNMRRAIFGNTPADMMKTQKMIEEALKVDDLKEKTFIKGHFIKAIDKTMGQIEQKNVVKEIVEKNDDNSGTLFNFEENKNTDVSKKRELENMCTDIVSFLGKGQNNGLSNHNDPKKLLEAIAEIATHYFAVGTISEVVSKNEIGDIDLSETHIQLNEIVDVANNTKKFGLSLFGVAGMDYMVDGSFDLATGIAKAMGVSTGIASIGIAALVGVGAGGVIKKDINRMQSDDFLSCKKTLGNIYNQIECRYLELFDDYMEEMKEKIEKKLIDESRVNQRAALVYNIQVSLNKIEDIMSDVFDSTAEEKYGLQSSF